MNHTYYLCDKFGRNLLFYRKKIKPYSSSYLGRLISNLHSLYRLLLTFTKFSKTLALGRYFHSSHARIILKSTRTIIIKYVLRKRRVYLKVFRTSNWSLSVNSKARSVLILRYSTAQNRNPLRRWEGVITRVARSRYATLQSPAGSPARKLLRRFLLLRRAPV